MKPKFQAQYSTTEQLENLYVLANQNGLYDAADVVRRYLDRFKEKHVKPNSNA